MGVRPFISWVGGKVRLLPQLRRLLPDDYRERRHVEPFMGAAALFFDQLPSSAVLADANVDLVNTFRVLRDSPDELIRTLGPLAAAHNKRLYYERRARFNAGIKSDVVRAAFFIYLLQTSYRHLWKTDLKGAVSNSIGADHFTINRRRLLRASIALKRAEIKVGRFESVLDYALPMDFVYFDPPYLPTRDSPNGFTEYTKERWSIDDFRRLGSVSRELSERGCRVMISHSDVPAVNDVFRGWNVHKVLAKRFFKMDSCGRQEVEVVLTNYDVPG